MRKVRIILLAALLALACAGCGGNADDAGKKAPDGKVDAADANEGENTAATMRLEKSEGSVSVADEDGKEQEPREKLPLFSGYGITTEATSYSWFNLDGTKLAKMDENSGASIEKENKHLKLLVDKGSLYFNITEPLEDDETLEIRTSSMTVGIRGTCGWVDAENDAVYIISGKVACKTPNGGEQVEVTDFTCARLKDGTFELEPYTSKDIPAFVSDELDEAYLLELNAYAEMAAAKAEKEANANKPKENDTPKADDTPKETAYGNGETYILAQSGMTTYELIFENGVLTTVYYDGDDGKDGWGEDCSSEIEDSEFYGMTVEEAAKILEEDYGLTVTIN